MIAKNRNFGIDLLRGLAIIGMVFAAVIPWTSEFPAWMYHAQVGPPDFKFNPINPGITWVDLVFPFFLFAMGAAFPLALRKKLDQKEYLIITSGLVRRGALLVFFAIALAYFTVDNLTASKPVNYITSLVVFAAFFMVFLRFEGSVWRRYGIQFFGFAIIVALAYYHSEIIGNTFSKSKNNIIILVLANMAVFGTICWLLTSKSHLLRIAVLVAFIGIWFSKGIEGSWTAKLWNFDPSMHWFYNFAYLKYLCIVLPGSILGDFILQYKDVNTKEYDAEDRKKVKILVLLCLSFVVFHVVTLYMRTLQVNLWGNVLFGIAFYFVFWGTKSKYLLFYKLLVAWGFTFATVALFFEPIDGGIKKDPSSFSYWFLTSGLAFVFYIVCEYVTKEYQSNFLVKAIVRNGQNPMIAYCVSAFFITPVLGLTQLLPVLDDLSAQSPYLGLIRTTIYMVLMIALTNYATNKKWFWKS